ncbi:MAG: C40 family peptidase [Bosea sp.]|uniref:NlpC/P60 family protein n=1 Tax=Bosea sp. (in: a-proteobacteria) TaxID=1871050 RepID=UPI001ACE70E9|nr:NlpC/P60 family protein [Bosea sp. (in: a-proteobacteria)]MBN9471661.1 C40 family peptidase [Bosea sp. (in: a-proteobacteria)]
MTRHWSHDLVGIPYRDGGRDGGGHDCWGLCRLAYAYVAGIELPAYDAVPCAGEMAETAALVDAVADGQNWIEVALGEARSLDVLVFRRGRTDRHLGLVLGAAAPGRMLHMVEGGSSVVASWSSGVWRWRLIGIRRHRELLGRGFA